MGMIKIDPDKLRARINATGSSMAEISRSIGYSDAFLSDSIRKKQLSNSAAIALDSIYGINLEEYRLIEEAKEKPVQETMNFDSGLTEAQKTSLKELIRSVMKDVLHEYFGNGARHED